MKRESFRSRLGFLLVSAGCAIGIGNVWRFPYIAGENGGGYFVLFYLLCLLVMGVPVLTMELAVGRASRRSAVLSYKTLEKSGQKWHIHGWFCLLGCYLLMMYYTTVSGWMVSYFGKFLTGAFHSGMSTDEVASAFGAMLSSPGEMALWAEVVVVAGFLVCSFGLQKGLERVTKVMMLCLLALLVVLAVRALTLPGAMEGVKFYLVPNFHNLMYDADYQTRATMFGRELPRGNDQELLDEALKVAAQADVIVAALGESSEMSGESSSRSELEMPDAQRHLLEALLKTGKPVVLVLFSGRPVVLTWENENVPAILNVWFGGSEAADAIADVVFGDVCPSGKLTTTFPQNVGQLPMAYNHKNTGRPLKEGKWFEKFRSNYLDVSNDPLYPFGYGLSYTTFQYSDITLSSKQLNADGKLTASVTVTNTGNYDADEIVQLYIRDLVGSITRPVKELKGFERIHLKKGESKQVTFTITPELLKFYNYDIQYVYEPGEFHVMIGPNSRDVKTTSFELK